MIPHRIVRLLQAQPGKYQRDLSQLPLVQENLEDLGLLGHDQVRQFFESYNLSGILGKRPEELLDLCSPTPQIKEATSFGVDVYGVPDGFLCLTSGEGEGFVLYSTKDRAVYEVAIDQLDQLEQGEIKPTYSSFFELIEWYLA